MWNNSVIKTEGARCIKNPLIYGSEQLKMKNNAEFNCICTLNKPNSPLVIFNSEGMIVDSQNGEVMDDFDRSNFTLE